MTDERSHPSGSFSRVERFRDDASWQEVAGYSRAVRRGRRILVSGTTASTEEGHVLIPDDTFAQTSEAIRRALAGVEQLGGSRDDVVRTRIFLAPQADWEEAARAHRDELGEVAPANTTLYVHALIGEGLLVEVELDAELEADVGGSIAR